METNQQNISGTVAVEVLDLVKVFGSGPAAVHALRGVDLVVPAGELLFLTGPSGSGKTTLLSILGCVLSPSGGVVRVLGEEIGALDDRALAAFRLQALGFVFQGHNLIASLSALENVRLPLLLQGVDAHEAEARAAEMLARVGLAAQRGRKPRELSGGQKQRVAIARALVGMPPLVLADEPTASLDAKSGQEVMELLAAMAEEGGHTVVVVTHDNRIFHFADRTVAIEDGRLVPGTSTAPNSDRKGNISHANKSR
jgi:putative ABC transport system ATP-binding protein